MERKITISIPEDNYKMLFRKAAEIGTEPEAIIESFVADLVGGEGTNGGDKREFAQQYFNRWKANLYCGPTYLQYLVYTAELENQIEHWKALKYWEKELEWAIADGDAEEEAGARDEMEYRIEQMQRVFNEYKRRILKAKEAYKPDTLEKEMQKVAEWYTRMEGKDEVTARC